MSSTTPKDDAPRVSALITPLAMGLWVLVGGLLAYGVTMTVIKAAALFN